MQARGHQDQNLAAGNTRGFERLEDRRQEDLVGHRAGNVANHDASTAAPGANSPNGGVPVGRTKLCRTAASGIGQRLRRPVLKAPNHVPVGQFHIQTRPAVFQVDSHGVEKPLGRQCNRRPN